MVLWREVSGVGALRFENEVLKFGVKWLVLPTRGLGDEPRDLFVRRQSKPTHKRRGFGLWLKFSKL
jgi:hypothetical protein